MAELVYIIAGSHRGDVPGDRVRTVLDSMERPALLVEGGAAGVDSVAADWAIERGVELHTEVANWKVHGKAAGPLRNRAMLDKFPHAVVIGFPGPDSKGTWDCLREAARRGMATTTCQPDGTVEVRAGVAVHDLRDLFPPTPADGGEA